MLLHSLLRQFDPAISLDGISDAPITGICEDSRHAAPGNLFIARPGTKTDGAKFIADAAARGAVAVVSGARLAGCFLPQVVVSDIAEAAARLADVYYGHPGRSVKVLAVTGTNGKTTTTYLLRHILAKVGIRCGVIGTVEIDDGASRREASMTTPSAVEVARLLADMRDNGCGACAIEVSSHALDQGRVAGVQFAAAAFTNLSRDHLDYHENMADYAAAKGKLFEALQPSAVAVVNGDDPWSERMIRDCRAKVLRFGLGNGMAFGARDVWTMAQGTCFTLLTPRGTGDVRSPMVGRHNVANILTAAALAGEAMGVAPHDIAAALVDCHGAPGRLQAVRCGQEFSVLVDYAHTDDALRNVLQALRPVTHGKLRVVFGCGGERDRGKRPLMAEVAEELADVIYVTSDNPRTENPQAIIDEILGGFSADVRNTARRLIVQPDRRVAIRAALADAGQGDVVLLAGKGHENYQIVGTEKHHFDDVEEAVKALGGRTIAA